MADWNVDVSIISLSQLIWSGWFGLLFLALHVILYIHLKLLMYCHYAVFYSHYNARSTYELLLYWVIPWISVSMWFWWIGIVNVLWFVIKLSQFIPTSKVGLWWIFYAIIMPSVTDETQQSLILHMGSVFSVLHSFYIRWCELVLPSSVVNMFSCSLMFLPNWHWEQWRD